jgi:hypothetical protein
MTSVRTDPDASRVALADRPMVKAIRLIYATRC